MLLTLLFVTHTVAEWVEISQQHYRKPMHAYNTYNPFTTPNRMEVEDTTKPWMYNNRSVSEYNWNEASKAQSNMGNIKRIMFQESAIKSAEILSNKEDNGDEFDLRTNHGPKRPSIQFSDNLKQKGTIEKIPNIGNIKRVQLHNSPVKSPTINIKGDSGTIAKSRYEELPLNNEKGQEGEYFPETKSNSKRIYVNDLRNRFSTERANVFPTERDEPSITEVRKRPEPEINNHTNQPKISSSKPTVLIETENVIQNAKDRFHDVNHGEIFAVTEKMKKIITDTFDTGEADIPKNNKELQKQQTHKNDNPKIPSGNINDLTKDRPLNKVPQTEYNKNNNDAINNDRKTHKMEENPKVSNLENEINEENIEHQPDINMAKHKEKKIESTKVKPENKIRNMENLLKLMKVVTETISQNTRRSFNGKVNYLHDLKDTILGNIAERIDATWPDDDVTTLTTHHRRRSRAAQASSRGQHVQFPSSESALMTISFLTFAVFLIKLVLQIIQTYKNKAMMVAPVLVSSGGRTILAQHGRL